MSLVLMESSHSTPIAAGVIMLVLLLTGLAFVLQVGKNRPNS